MRHQRPRSGKFNAATEVDIVVAVHEEREHGDIAVEVDTRVKVYSFLSEIKEIRDENTERIDVIVLVAEFTFNPVVTVITTERAKKCQTGAETEIRFDIESIGKSDDIIYIGVAHPGDADIAADVFFSAVSGSGKSDSYQKCHHK